MITVIRFPNDAMMTSARVVFGFEIYLCLWKTVADTRVTRVLIIQIFHARSCSKEVPRTYPFIQCAAKVFMRLGLSCNRDYMSIGTNVLAL